MAFVWTAWPSTFLYATSATSPAVSVLPLTENVFSTVSPAGIFVNLCSPETVVTRTSIGTVSVFVTEVVSQSCLPAALHDGVAVPEKSTAVAPGSAPISSAVADWSNDALP